MLSLENISTGELCLGSELEYFIDEENMTGDVYLDGDLIFQAMDVITEEALQLQLQKEFVINIID